MSEFIPEVEEQRTIRTAVVAAAVSLITIIGAGVACTYSNDVRMQASALRDAQLHENVATACYRAQPARTDCLGILGPR